MNPTPQIAKHFKDVHFGGNWTTSNLKDNLADVSWQEATTQVYNLNTIGTLAYHIHYYINAVLQVLKGGPLDAHDKFSFACPPIQSQQDWQELLDTMWADAEEFARLVAELPEDKWETAFTDEKYGNYYRNMHGIIEHTHYHLGQIAVIKKILRQQVATTI